MNLWMKGLDSAIKDFWETCDILNGDGFDTSGIQSFLGTTSRDDFKIEGF